MWMIGKKDPGLTREESTRHVKGLLEEFKSLTKRMDDDIYYALFKVKPCLKGIAEERFPVPKWMASIRWNADRYIEFYADLIDYIERHSTKWEEGK